MRHNAVWSRNDQDANANCGKELSFPPDELVLLNTVSREITPHLFILPKSWILNLPAMPSSMNSNSPMYLFFCMERRTAEPSFEAGTTRQSFLFLTSLL